jgi:phage head maturation protease
MLPRRDQLLRRYAESGTSSGGPLSYNKSDHTVEAVLSKGTAVKRIYGTEVLRISPQAIDLSRLHEGGIPFLDHHNQAGIDQVLGRITDAWIKGNALMGRIVFAQTPQGIKAEGMVARGEITGISAGYRVDQWQITDADGDVVDERDVRWDDDLTFTATRWQLFEASLVGVPADGAAAIRSIGGRGDDLEDVKARVLARHRMMLRVSGLRDDE